MFLSDPVGGFSCQTKDKVSKLYIYICMYICVYVFMTSFLPVWICGDPQISVQARLSVLKPDGRVAGFDLPSA